MTTTKQILKRYHYHQISSTNDYAKELIKDNQLIMVTTDYQLKGRGRKNREWTGDLGKNIYLSFGINHDSIACLKNYFLYQAIGALSVFNVLSLYIDKEIIKLKYPNDIFIKHNTELKKISGVLTEHNFIADKCMNSIIGIGINIFQKEYNFIGSYKAISLSDLVNNPDIEKILFELQEEFVYLINLNEFLILDEWKRHLNFSGKKIKLIDNEITYEFLSILESGRLLLKNPIDNSVIEVDNGDSLIYNLE